MSADQRTQRRAFLIFLIFLCVLLLYIFAPFLIPIILGTVLVILFYPIYHLFLKICRDRRYLASSITVITILFFLVVPVTLIGSLVTNQLYGMVNQKIIPFVEQETLANRIQQLYGSFEQKVDELEKNYGLDLHLKNRATTALKEVATYISKNSPNVVMLTLSFIAQGFITLIVALFLFVEGEKLYHDFLELLPLKTTHEREITLQMRDTVYGIVYGTFVTAFVQALLAGIAFYILGIEGYLVWGALTFLFSFIPIVGAGAVWVPATIFLFLFGQTWQWIFMGLYGVLGISMADNVLKPLMMRGKNKIHPIPLFLSILGAIHWVGPLGILLGPITLAVLVASIQIYKQDYFLRNE